MKLYSQFILLGITLALNEGARADTKTNLVPAKTNTATLYYEQLIVGKLAETPSKNWSWLKWFEYELANSSEDNRRIRFGNTTKFRWVQAYFSSTEKGPSRAESQGEQFFSGTFGDGALDAFSEWFDFNRFKGEKVGLTFGAKLVEGTIATKEGRRRPGSLDPEDTASFNSWAESFLSDYSVKYGFNLLNNYPYAYYSRSFGHRKDGLPILIWNNRFRVLLSKLDVNHPRLEEELTAPLGPQTSISAGARIYPTALDNPEWQPAFTIKLSHLFSTDKYDNLLYASYQHDSKEQIVLVGASFDMEWLAEKIFRR